MRGCVIAGCTKSAGNRAHLCQMHYERLRLRGTTYRHAEPTCRACDRPVVANGVCRTHYMKLRRTGTLERLRREARPGGMSAREHHLLNRYGLSVETYERMEAEQRGCCAICGDPQRPHTMFVDHDHRDGSVRDLLCRSCNTMLGMVERRDDPDRVLSAALAYCDAHCI